MANDQGNTYKSYLKAAILACDDAYRQDDDPFRSHLGGSMIGRRCARQLWYGFRWFHSKNHTGRMIRLFNRGHLEEARFIAMLQSIGVTVWYEDDAGKQFRMSASEGHIGGSLDSVLENTPDFPDEPILGEYKTHGEKSFLKLKREGVQKSKPEHYTQMQLYMNHYGLRAGLYMAVNKNNDELYTEIVMADPTYAEQHLSRADRIVWAAEPPPKISDSKTAFDCKFCDFYDICHNGFTPATNCRTCRWSQPVEGKQWVCRKHLTPIDKDLMKTGCQDHELIAQGD
jgi:hypothetical protein